MTTIVHQKEDISFHPNSWISPPPSGGGGGTPMTTSNTNAPPVNTMLWGSMWGSSSSNSSQKNKTTTRQGRKRKRNDKRYYDVEVWDPKTQMMVQIKQDDDDQDNDDDDDNDHDDSLEEENEPEQEEDVHKRSELDDDGDHIIDSGKQRNCTTHHVRSHRTRRSKKRTVNYAEPKTKNDDNDTQEEEEQKEEEKVLNTGKTATTKATNKQHKDEHEQNGDMEHLHHRKRKNNRRTYAAVAASSPRRQRQLEQQQQQQEQEQFEWKVHIQPLLVALNETLLSSTSTDLLYMTNGGSSGEDDNLNANGGNNNNDDVAAERWSQIFKNVPISGGAGCLLHVTLPPSLGVPEHRFWYSQTVRKTINNHLDLGQLLCKFLLEPVDSVTDITNATKLFYQHCCSRRRDKADDDDDESNKEQGSCRNKNHNSDDHDECFDHCYWVAEDLLWWQSRRGILPLKDLAKLRRILLPFTILVTSEKNGRQVVCVQQLDWSLADLILEDKKRRGTSLVQALVRTLQLLKQVNHSQVAAMDDIVQYREIQELIVTACRKFGGQVTLEERNLTLDSLKMMEDIPLPYINSTRRSYSEERSLELKDIQAKRAELQEQHYKSGSCGRKNRPISTIITQDKTGMTEEQFLRETSFMHRVNCTFPRQFDLVESRPRFAQTQFTAEELSQLQQVFFNDDGSLSSTSCLDASRTLRNHYIIFCNDSGAGSEDKRWQIPIKNHFAGSVQTRSNVEKVLFQSGVLDEQYERLYDLVLLIGGTEDQSLHHDLPRDWVTWRRQSSTTNNNNNNNHNHTLNNNSNSPVSVDLMNDDDSLGKGNGFCETVGWEANRLGYNTAMLSKHAPAVLLVPMDGHGTTTTTTSSSSSSSSSTTKTTDTSVAAAATTVAATTVAEEQCLMIGVQKDQIIRCASSTTTTTTTNRPGSFCRIRHGNPCEEFEIVRENKHLVVLKVMNGCMFTGDFPHAGASCCNALDVNDDDLCCLAKQFWMGIDELVVTSSDCDENIPKQQEQQQQETQQQASMDNNKSKGTDGVLEFCRKFKGLNRLCRLYIATEWRESVLNVPPNIVGYYKCYSNQPTYHYYYGNNNNNNNVIHKTS